MPISRSTFLKGLAGCTVAAVAGKLYLEWHHRNYSGSEIPCRMLGPAKSLGHRLRDGKLPQDDVAQQTEAPLLETVVTIVGGGIAGLSAGWWLQKQGVTDFIILELENTVGGNASSGRNDISAFPWGAHYVPLANEESAYVRMLFAELGIIQELTSTGLPVYNELYLCHDPQERLLKDGMFQEGMVPKRGLQKEDNTEIGRFFELMHELRQHRGTDGKPAFAIPLDLSSQDRDLLSLDNISMSHWMQQNGFYSKPLLWYINYCCRDDYGSTIDNVSAWAGIHYFAGRRGKAANAEMNSVVTWPEGNGFLVAKLRDKLQKHIRTGAMVTKITTPTTDQAMAICLDAQTNKYFQVKSQYIIFAAPRFIARHVPVPSQELNYHDLAYAPWMVANITLKDIPEGKGSALAWDNVSYYSDSLGYVVATHQNITTRTGPTVITYYYPMSGSDPHTSRQQLFSALPQEWSKRIIDDLEKMHPEISKEIVSIDLWPWGHGMIRPSVGYIWGDTRKKMRERTGKILFAHSDMSGMSNFEEAQYQGVEAAKQVLQKLGLEPKLGRT